MKGEILNKDTVEGVSPFIKQYLEIKDNYKDYLLLYRMGDFYELFFTDAIEAANKLNIVLTKRGTLREESIPMCGIPAHSSEGYIAKLVKLGCQLAICEQIETPEEAKKRGSKAIVNREVVRVITAGTLLEEHLLESVNNNFILSISYIKKVGLSWLDISTGAFFYAECDEENLESLLIRIAPQEILITEELANSLLTKKTPNYNLPQVTKYPASFFAPKKATNAIQKFYHLYSLQTISTLTEAEIAAIGGLLEYAQITKIVVGNTLPLPIRRNISELVYIDGVTLRSLEIFKTQDGEYRGSLLHTINYALTGGGSRLIKEYLSHPINNITKLNKRLDLVEFFVNQLELRNNIRNILKNLPDLERSNSRVNFKRAEPRDLNVIKTSLLAAFSISQELVKVKDISLDLHLLYDKLGENTALINLLSSAVEVDANKKQEENFIKKEFNPKLAELKNILQNNDLIILELINKYRSSLGINNIKINYNNLIGYYIEVSSNKSITAEGFIHKQSLINTNRYVTAELKELEHKILHAKQLHQKLELEIFNNLCDEVIKYNREVMQTANALAEIDLLVSFAELAAEKKYTRPTFSSDNKLYITKGRHPVLERNIDFIANNINLDTNNHICLLTGPNMAGKSTFLRQNALIAILAHIGSFVPAQLVQLGIIDKIFSRVGSADNLAKNQSTFMVEMLETAAIVNQATNNSLVILDEVGRGTSVEDGLAISQAVLEYLHNFNKCRTIFSTHFGELCSLENTLPKLTCYTTKIIEWEEEVIFLYEVEKGKNNKAYGIYIAKLAGMPEFILERATNLLTR